MQIGKLRNKLTIEALNVTARDSFGGETVTPAIHSLWWCELVQVSGGEAYRGRVMHAEATSLASGRFISGVTPQMRATLGSRTFDIVNVYNVDGRSRELQLELKERAL